MSGDLAATVAGSPSAAAPIVGAAWAACRAVLAKDPGRWLDPTDVADQASALVDCRPSLPDELIHAAATAGLIQIRIHRGNQLVRLVTEKGKE